MINLPRPRPLREVLKLSWSILNLFTVNNCAPRVDEREGSVIFQHATNRKILNYLSSL